MSRFSRGIVAAGLLAATAIGSADAASVDPLNHLVLCSPGQAFTDTAIDNEFFSLEPGQVSTFLGTEKGEALGLRIEVLEGAGSTAVVAGVTTRVVKEIEWVDDDGDGEVAGLPDEPLIEESLNYFAQVASGPNAGTVCYFGEEVEIYEDGVFQGDTSGSWRAGVGDNTPGIFMPASPTKGQFFQTENAPGVAMDEATITAVGRAVKVPAGSTREAIKVRDCNPLEKPVGCGTKYYAPGFGLIVDGPLDLADSGN
jgi:hypothetical protein